MLTIRVVVAAVFMVAMFAFNKFVHFAVDFGPVAWVLLFAGLGVIGFVVTDRDKKAAGLPGYSWPEARRELVFPLGGLVAILLVA